jgi:hypothetical protein
MNPLPKRLKLHGGVEKLIFSFAFVLTLGFVVFPGKVFAQNPWSILISGSVEATSTICNPTQAIFQNIAEDQPQQSIVRFAYNYDTTRYLKLFYNVFGMSIDNVVKCIPVIGGFTNAACLLLTGGLMDDKVCTNAFGRTAGLTKDFATNPVSGSLIGLYLKLDAAKTYADPPANLAYFFSQEFKNVPFVGKAFAQYHTDEYQGLFITRVYFAWRLVRDFAFATLALIMLFVGFMMINRTKVNPQTIVNIQYALPKIILAIVLVAFSYPIAATMTNFFYAVSLTAPRMVVATAWNDLAAQLSGYNIDSFKTTMGNVNIISILIYSLASMLQMVALGPVLLIVWTICVIAIIIQLLLILIKWLMIYAQMIIEIVLSPVDLVLSALPGSEDKSEDSKVVTWFKKFLAYGLSLFVLSALPTLVMLIGLAVLIGGAAQVVAFPGGGIPLPSLAGAGFDLTLFFFIVIMGLRMTSKLPGQIQFMLMGKGPESRDRK